MSVYNLPDGCSPGDPHAPWNEEPERCCGTCVHQDGCWEDEERELPPFMDGAGCDDWEGA